MFFVRPSVSISLIVLWILWRMSHILKHAHRSMSDGIKAQNIRFVELPTWFGRKLSCWSYLLSGPGILLKHYEAGTVVGLPTSEANYIHVSSDAHIKELLGAPEDTLSLRALSKTMLQPKHTMNGLEVEDNMSANVSVHLRILSVVLRNSLDTLEPALYRAVSQVISSKIQTSGGVWEELQIFDFAKNIILAGNCVIFFGEELSSNPAFVQAALQYPDNLFKTAEVLRLLPAFFGPWITQIFMRYHKASKLLVENILYLIEQRLGDQKRSSRSIDVVQFFLDASTKAREQWPPEQIVQAILGIWFASTHQPAPSLAYTVSDICIENQHLIALRKELSFILLTMEQRLKSGIDDLSLLDAFLKESARLHPSDSISCRRQALKPFQFRDGTEIYSNVLAVVINRHGMQPGPLLLLPHPKNRARNLNTRLRSTPPAWQ